MYKVWLTYDGVALPMEGTYSSKRAADKARRLYKSLVPIGLFVVWPA